MAGLALVAIVLYAVVAVESAATETKAAIPRPFHYPDLVDDYKNAVKELLELSPPGGDFGSAYNLHGLPINDRRLHYGFLVATLDVISETLSVLCPPSYESEYFPAVRKAVAATLESTSSIGNQLSLVLTVVDGNLQNALELVEEKCGQGQDDCDQAVRDAVDADSEKYAQALDLLQLVGRASELYLQNTYRAEATNFSILKLLVESQDELKPLALSVAKVKMALNTRGHTPNNQVQCSPTQ